MTDLHDLLDRCVDTPLPGDLAADLRRGHRALHRRRQTWMAGALGLAAVATGATALQQHTGPHSTELVPADSGSTASPSTSPSTGATASATGARLFSPGDVAGPLTVASTDPRESRFYPGHVHEGLDRLPYVTLQIAPEGPVAGGQTVTFEGRTFFEDTDAHGATVLMVRDSHDLWLRLTTPEAMGWPLDEQLRFLAGSGTVIPEPGT